MFLADSENKLKEIETAIKEGDYKKLVEVSHALKGASGNIGLTKTYQLCLELENIGKKKENLSVAERLLTELKENITAIRGISL